MSMDKGPIADKIPRIKIIFVRLAELGIRAGYIFEKAKVRPIFLN